MFIDDEVRRHAQVALGIQDAVNLGSIVAAWANAQPAIRAHCAVTGGHFLTHPIQLMFLSKVSSLMAVTASCIGGLEQGDADVFGPAYKACKQLAGEVGP